MGTRRSADHQKRKRMEYHLESGDKVRAEIQRELQPKLDLARKFAERRLRTFAEEIPQAFMVRFFGKEQSMSTQLPEEEPGSIPWEGGEENKGDEPGETPDPHTTETVDEQKAEQRVADSQAVESRAETVNANDDDF